MKILGIIPSRYASSRFPGKPLVDIDGKPMIQRVYEQAKKAKALAKVIVATDDERIENCVQKFGGVCIMTSSEHQSGTDRCAEVIGQEKENYDVVINIQGDEPFVDPKMIDEVCACFEDKNTRIATLAKKITDIHQLHNPNKPKVIISETGKAIYFSRHPIPFQQGVSPEKWLEKHTYYKHIGIYAYRTAILKQLSQLDRSALEISESLEQLRWLENNYSIQVKITHLEALAIDTPEDLKKVLANKS